LRGGVGDCGFALHPCEITVISLTLDDDSTCATRLVFFRVG
jgi:hypothetical protein